MDREAVLVTLVLSRQGTKGQAITGGLAGMALIEVE